MHTLALTLVAAGLTAMASTQDPAAQSPLRPLPPTTASELGIDTDTAADGSLWAAGPTWKACFAADGTMFVPCFGSSAPRNFPARLQRAVVTVAGKVVTDAAVAPTFAHEAVEYRGQAFTERYALRDAGIEQQLVFATLPTRGALQVTVPFTTELEFAGNADGGFRFANEYGSFGYGRAVAIDADGDRLDLTTEWTGNGFRISVPAEFVAAAALPLVIDPLLGAIQTVASDTRSLASTDLAYDASLGRHALVWERVFSATDSDVFCRYLDTAMVPQGTTISVDVTTESWRRPQIACIESNDRFLVVAQASTGNVAPFRGIGRLVFGPGAALSTSFALLAGGGNVLHLDVGGDASTVAGSQFLVAGEVEFSPTDHDIQVQSVQFSGTTGPIRILDASTAWTERPQVSKHCGLPGGASEGWGVAYLRRGTPTGLQPMFGRVDRSATTLTGGATVGALLSATRAEVAVSSPTDHADGRHFGYLIGELQANGGTAWRVGVVSPTATLLGMSLSSTSNWSLHGVPQIETDGLRFLTATCVENPGNPSQHNLGFGLFDHASNSIWGRGETTLGTFHRAGSLVIHRPTIGANGEASVAWVQGSGGVIEVDASRFGVYQDGPQLASRSTACGGLGFLSGGTSNLGGTVDMQLVGANGLLGWVVGLPVDLPVGPCPGCRQGVNGSPVLGAAMHFSVPRNTDFVGITVAFQGFQFVPNGQVGACLGQVNLSNTLDVTVR